MGLDVKTDETFEMKELLRRIPGVAPLLPIYGQVRTRRDETRRTVRQKLYDQQHTYSFPACSVPMHLIIYFHPSPFLAFPSLSSLSPHPIPHPHTHRRSAERIRHTYGGSATMGESVVREGPMVDEFPTMWIHAILCTEAFHQQQQKQQPPPWCHDTFGLCSEC